MSNPATFKQAYHLLALGCAQDISLETLQVLYRIGVLSDVFGVEDPSRINREAVRLGLGYDPSVFKVKMGGPETTDQITAALGFPFSEWITQANFPLRQAEIIPWEDEIEIVDPECSFSKEEALQILEGKGLLRPTYKHGIRFAEQYGKEITSRKKSFIVFPHEAWQGLDRVHRVHQIICLNRNPHHRRLGLSCPDYKFHDGCVIAGVRPHK